MGWEMSAKNSFINTSKLLLITLLILVCQLAFSQQYQVSGVVTDSQNNPLPGITILIKGTVRGTSTDINGNFTLQVNQGDVLRISFVGYKTQEITLDETTRQYNIALLEGVELGEVVILGSRNKNRTAVETPVPVDVLDIQELTFSTPQLNVNQILNYVAPSFTSTPQTVSDGTDHIDPASLRGLGPDQLLVLVNGKRRHTTSLVNVNSTVGRGSVGTDLNAIPAFAIKRIEVLRDGAAAQYGSDAISGVINIVLKDQYDGLEIAINRGANFSSESNNQDGGIDGQQFQVNANYGIPLTDNGGFINFTGSIFTREPTSRAGKEGFSGSIFNAYNAIERVATQAGVDISTLTFNDIQTFGQQVSHFSSDLQANIADALTIEDLQSILNVDVTDAELAAREQTRRDYSMKVGQSALRSGKFISNMEIPLNKDLKFYAFGDVSYRNGQAAGFYRRPDQSRANTLVYINGFLPEIYANIKDKSIAAGIIGTVNEWRVDFSNTWGRNSFDFTITNSSNASMDRSTPITAYAGGFAFTQNTSNLDLTRYYDDILSGFNIALGLEYRFENYQLFEGQEESYATYDINGDVVKASTPDTLLITDFFGRTRPGGIQVFPGFRPENQRDRFRNSYAAYLDFEADLSENVIMGLAGRYENYSDFGDTFNWKVTSRFGVIDNFSIRIAASTGFRAPSLHQLHFNATSTNFINGIPFEIGTFSNDSRVAELLGIQQLRQEKSFSASVGFTADIPSANLTITIDGFYTGIEDRVVLTGNFTRPETPTSSAEQELQLLFDAAAATRARFFANAIDTETTGIDLVIAHETRLSENTILSNNFAANVSRTHQVGDIKVSKILANAGLTDTYFGSRDQLFLQVAQPRTKANLSHSLKSGNWNFFVRNTLFGKVTNPNTDSNGTNPVYRSKVINDFSIGYKFSELFNLSLGANNVFDVYPDLATADLTSGNNFIYPRSTSQFGLNGRYLFVRLNMDLK